MHSSLKIAGTFTALVTPFASGGKSIDLEVLDRLVDAQIAGGVAGLVPCGTTGETPTLTADEQAAVIARVAGRARKRVPVIAGAGSFDTAKTIASCLAALEAGADAVMVVMPYYSKPSQDGMCAHVKAVAAAVQAPIVLYNVPSRSAVDLSAEATVRICEQVPEVVALKDATGNVQRCQQLKRLLGDRLAVMCGDDALTLAMMAVGASGVISVTANVLPAEVSEVPQLVAKGDYAAARKAHYRLLPLHGLMFAEPSPAPCKAALDLLGLAAAQVRLPILPASDGTHRRLAAELAELGKAPVAG